MLDSITSDYNGFVFSEEKNRRIYINHLVPFFFLEIIIKE